LVVPDTFFNKYSGHWIFADFFWVRDRQVRLLFWVAGFSLAFLAGFLVAGNIKHKKELLTETYALTEATDKTLFPVALTDLCNDSIRREKFNKISELKSFSTQKNYPSYPAVKITRLGVHHEFQRNNIGSFLLNVTKQFFVTDNRTGCRFLTVDAYNRDNILKFYTKNDFQFFYDKDKNRKTRAMFFDLKRLNLNK